MVEETKTEELKEKKAYIKGVGIVEEVGDKTPIDILKQESDVQEIESYKKGVNWLEDEYLGNSWKRLKAKNLHQVKQSDFLFQLFSPTGEVIGKPQIRDNDVKTNITLLVKAVKKDKEGEPIISYKFIDDPYNRRDDGYEDSVIEESFWIYDVIQDG